MNRTEHLLVVLGEEAGEVAQETSKCLRFGPEEIFPEIGISNADRIILEFNDLLAMMELLEAEGIFKGPLRREDLIAAKKLKFEKNLKYSQECGRYQPS